jgi:hypothetical protein
MPSAKIIANFYEISPNISTCLKNYKKSFLVNYLK